MGSGSETRGPPEGHQRIVSRTEIRTQSRGDFWKRSHWTRYTEVYGEETSPAVYARNDALGLGMGKPKPLQQHREPSQCSRLWALEMQQGADAPSLMEMVFSWHKQSISKMISEIIILLRVKRNRKKAGRRREGFRVWGYNLTEKVSTDLKEVKEQAVRTCGCRERQ